MFGTRRLCRNWKISIRIIRQEIFDTKYFGKVSFIYTSQTRRFRDDPTSFNFILREFSRLKMNSEWESSFLKLHALFVPQFMLNLMDFVQENKWIVKVNWNRQTSISCRNIQNCFFLLQRTWNVFKCRHQVLKSEWNCRIFIYIFYICEVKMEVISWKDHQ